MLAPYYTETEIEAGLDEAGRGCLAGPVVAAAVILPKDFYHPLLNDSKQLTHLQRETLYEVIIENALAFSIQEVSHEIIDQINILNASLLAMHHCVDALTIKPNLLLIDGNRFKPYPFIQHVCIVKGDAKFASIAAASVLAKVHRDRLMTHLHSQFPHYAWDKNAGYPTKKHREGILNHGTSPYHRLSFRLLAKGVES